MKRTSMPIVIGLLATVTKGVIQALEDLEIRRRESRDELRQMDQRTRILMTMHKALHHRDDVDRLYVPRKEGGRGLSSIEDSVDTSIQRLEDYIEKHERGLITAIRNNIDNTIDNRMTKN